MNQTRSKKVSIIIPSLNSPIIDRVLAAIDGQDQADQITEILVVGKDEARLVKSNQRVTLIDTEHPVPPATARNVGIRAAIADLLIFLDSDCLPQPGWLSAHLAAHAIGHEVVSGSVVPDGDNYWSLSYNLAMFHEYFGTAAPAPRDFLPTLNLSVDRRVIDRVGLLDETLPRSQDMEWTIRMKQSGFQPYFWPEAVIQHCHNRSTMSRVWQDCARSGYHARLVRLQHRKALSTPFWFRSRIVLLVLSPLIAGWVTGRILVQNWRVIFLHFYTLPAIYLSKIAWCWGAGRVEA